jgi:hypothetical protein
MRRPSRTLVLVAVFAAAAGCASQQTGGESASRYDRSLLTADQLRDHNYQSAFDAVEALRTNWLRPRGTDSFNNPSVVVVYLDNVKLGGVETLRGVQVANVQAIRHYDANDATSRWGVGHSSGAIQVITLSGSEKATLPPDAGR